MNRLIIFVVLILAVSLAFLSPHASAQGGKPTCDPSAVIKKAAALASTGDAKKDMAALLELRDDISAANIACNGLTFKGAGSKVVDPFVLPKGLYRVKLDFNARNYNFGFMYIDPEHCIDARVLSSLSKSKEETARAYEDCRMTVEAATYDDTSPWTLTLEPLK